MSDLLPPNATPLERRLAAVNARLGELDTAPLRNLLNPATCPAALLPWLAYGLSVDLWDDTWSEAQKRAVCAASIAVHRSKGTRAAVLSALAALDVTASIIEWFQEAPQAAPYTFKVDIETESQGMTAARLGTIEQQITALKPVRSHFKTRLVVTPRAALYFAATTQDLITTTIYPKAP